MVMDHNDNPPPTPTARSVLRRIGALVLPAVIGAGAALGVVAMTVGLGDDTATTLRDDPVVVIPDGTRSDAPARGAEGSPSPTDDLSVPEVVKRESPAVVLISSRTARGSSLGSGFLIDTHGHILTNAHVVDGATATTVTFSDGTVTTGRILGVDPSTDLAVIAIATVPDGVSPIPLGNSSELVVGQDVVAIGNPYGYERTATTGIISALKRVIESPNGFSIQNAIQTDAAINHGNSGGPLLDRAGRVIGMNSQIASESGGNVGIGFAVPIDTIEPIAAAIIAGEGIEHAWIGITGRDLTPALAAALDLTGRRGVLVADVDQRGPAADAGIRGARNPDADVPRGADLIIAVNGRPVTDMADVSMAVASRTVGDRITITVLRDGEEKTVGVTLGNRPVDIGRP